MVVKTRSQEETRALARSLARHLKPGDFICLSGPLGAGKTRFVQGLAAGLGFKGGVLSPTFTLAREYQGKELKLYHLDLFRLKAKQLRMIGWEEFISDPTAACAVEWAEIAENGLPPDRLEARIASLKDGSRRLSLKATGAHSRRLLTCLE